MYKKKLKKIIIKATCIGGCMIVLHYVFSMKNNGGLTAVMGDFIANSYESSCESSELFSGENNEAKDEPLYNAKTEESHIIGNVPHIYQMYAYPTGCESVSAVSLMQYYGIDISVDRFIDEYLPCADTPCYFGGILAGESPYDFFLGNPRSEYGFGCYLPVIRKAIESCVGNSFVVTAAEEKDLCSLAKKYISADIPVMIWATMGMQEAREGDSWRLPSGEIFTFIRPEHALLLIGYDDASYYFSDPMEEAAVVSYDKASCERAFEALFCQALVLLPNK